MYDEVSFDEAELEVLIAGHAADNLASGRLLAKLGFLPTGESTVFSKPRGTEIVVRHLRLMADAWRSRAADPAGA